jgi:hypothetical protein
LAQALQSKHVREGHRHASRSHHNKQTISGMPNSSAERYRTEHDGPQDREVAHRGRRRERVRPNDYVSDMDESPKGYIDNPRAAARRKMARLCLIKKTAELGSQGRESRDLSIGEWRTSRSFACNLSHHIPFWRSESRNSEARTWRGEDHPLGEQTLSSVCSWPCWFSAF